MRARQAGMELPLTSGPVGLVTADLSLILRVSSTNNEVTFFFFRGRSRVRSVVVSSFI